MFLTAGELLTYEKLKTYNIDSVCITKLSETKYRIDFAAMGSYESFINK